MYALRSRGMGTYISWPICGYPNQQIQVPNPGLSGYRRGLGCGCGCGGSCFKGLGQVDTVVNVTPSGGSVAPATWYTNLFPSGTLFGSGSDISGWGLGEWGIVAIAGYVLISVFTTTQRLGRRAAHIAGGPKRAYRRAGKRVSGARRRLARAIEGEGSFKK